MQSYLHGIDDSSHKSGEYIVFGKKSKRASAAPVDPAFEAALLAEDSRRDREREYRILEARRERVRALDKELRRIQEQKNLMVANAAAFLAEADIFSLQGKGEYKRVVEDLNVFDEEDENSKVSYVWKVERKR